MRIAILGGGVAGTVLAGCLSERANCDIVLFERNDRLGGLHHSEEFDGLQFDIGCFLFDPRHHFLQAFPQLYDHFTPVAHVSRVLTQSGGIDAYPMTIGGYRRDRSTADLAGDILALLRAKVTDRRRDSLRAYVEYYLGPRIYRRSGLKHYIERFYGRPDTDVDLAFALQRLDGLPHAAGLRRNALRFLCDAVGQPVDVPRWNCYVRPPSGFRFVYGKIAELLRGRGVDLRLGADVSRVERESDGCFCVHDGAGGVEAFDLVVSTIPPGLMMRLIGRPMGHPPSTIRLVSLCYRFTGSLGFEDAGMFCNFTNDARWKRITLFSAQYGRAEGDHYFTVECTLPREDPTTPVELRADFEQHIAGLDCFDGRPRFVGQIVTPHAYPVLTATDIEQSRRASEELVAFGIYITGRQARFVHRTSNAIAADSIALADKLIATHDITSIDPVAAGGFAP